MDRIKVEPFHEMTLDQQYKLITDIRNKRKVSLEVARTSRGRGMTKSAMKNIKKLKGKKRVLKDPKKAAIAALNKLSPEQIARIKDLL